MKLGDLEHAVSAEPIYRHALACHHVYSADGRRAGLPRLLARRKSKRRRNGPREPPISSRTPIHQRPTKVHLRSQFSHWEDDLLAVVQPAAAQAALAAEAQPRRGAMRRERP
jgi:IS30 family transposase